MRFLSFLMIFILFSISNYAQKKSNIVLEPVKKGLTDDQLLEEVQKVTFRYFWDFADPVSGLAR